jgi:hypothetical protein
MKTYFSNKEINSVKNKKNSEKSFWPIQTCIRVDFRQFECDFYEIVFQAWQFSFQKWVGNWWGYDVSVFFHFSKRIANRFECLGLYAEIQDLICFHFELPAN